MRAEGGISGSSQLSPSLKVHCVPGLLVNGEEKRWGSEERGMVAPDQRGSAD